jgi:EmrB/QacA subfamily drug resistance transporter
MRTRYTEEERRITPDIWRVAIVVILGMFMSALDTTVVNVALISLGHDLHTQIDSVQWVVTAYLLALAAVIPVSGWAASRYGAKRLFIISTIMFTVGSLLCGTASSLTMLVFFRVLQGVGGGLIAPLGMMILIKKAGPAKLARVMSAISVPIIMAPILGPTLGGILLDDAGWRWIFFINIPIGIIAVIAAVRLLPRDEPEQVGPLDLPGFVLIAAGLVGITYGLSAVGSTSISATKVWGPLIGGVCLIAAFVIRELHVEFPLLDMRLYRNKAFTAASLTTFALGAAMFGGLILLPLYYQIVRGQDAIHTGLLLAPQGIGSATAMWVAGRAIDRYGAGLTALTGGIIGMIGMIPLLLVGPNTSYVEISFVMVVRGFGVGLTAMPAMTAAYRTMRPDQINDATPQLNVLQRVGGSIGTAVLTVILQSHLNAAGTSVTGQAHAFDIAFGWVLASIALATIPVILLLVIERSSSQFELPPEMQAEALVSAA